MAEQKRPALDLTDAQKKAFAVRIQLTPEQAKQVEETTGLRAYAIEVPVRWQAGQPVDVILKSDLVSW